MTQDRMVGYVLIAAAIVGLLAPWGKANAADVFKCRDGARPLYTTQPCDGGVRIDTKAVNVIAAVESSAPAPRSYPSADSYLFAAPVSTVTPQYRGQATVADKSIPTGDSWIWVAPCCQIPFRRFH